MTGVAIVTASAGDQDAVVGILRAASRYQRAVGQ